MSCGWSVRGIAALVLALGGGCVAQNVIAVAPGSTRDSLVFVVRGAKVGASPNLVFGLGVVRCADDRPMWIIAAEGSRLMPDSLRYGEPVPGFALRAGPEPLGPDCYRAVASGAVPLRFVVDPAGGIRTQP